MGPLVPPAVVVVVICAKDTTRDRVCRDRQGAECRMRTTAKLYSDPIAGGSLSLMLPWEALPSSPVSYVPANSAAFYRAVMKQHVPTCDSCRMSGGQSGEPNSTGGMIYRECMVWDSPMHTAEKLTGHKGLLRGFLIVDVAVRATPR